jgi:hypothetical protein
LQVNSHASRGWRVNEFYIAQFSNANLFIANLQLPIAYSTHMPVRFNRELAIGNRQYLEANDGGLFDDMAIAHLYDAFAHGRGLGIVSDHDDCLVEPVIQLLEHVKDEG